MRIRYLAGTESILERSRLLEKNPEACRGRWLSKNPDCRHLAMEIGCGKGRFAGEMAGRHPETYYIGVEKFSTILAHSILNNEADPDRLPSNLAFVRSDALDLDGAIADGELDRLYLNFSDPWPKERHEKRRLTSGRFLPLYARWLKKDGELHFKTDNPDLFRYSEDSLLAHGWKLLFETTDWHACPESKEDVMTEYEIQFSAMGRPVFKLTAVYTSGSGE